MFIAFSVLTSVVDKRISFRSLRGGVYGNNLVCPRLRWPASAAWIAADRNHSLPATSHETSGNAV